MALRPVEGCEVEVGRQRQGIQLDPVLERFARQPQRPRAQHHEAMSKSASQRSQPNPGRVVGEYHQDRRNSGLMATRDQPEPVFEDAWLGACGDKDDAGASDSDADTDTDTDSGPDTDATTGSQTTGGTTTSAGSWPPWSRPWAGAAGASSVPGPAASPPWW